MAKYFGHKPQWRTRTTGRPAPVLDFERDFRSGEFKFTGPVYQPDMRSSRSGRVPSVPRQAGRTWGSPVNFNARDAFDASKKRAFYKALGRGMSGVFRYGKAAMDVYDMFQDIQRDLGGEPYTIMKEELWAGGPKADGSNYDVRGHVDFPGNWVVTPSPDGTSGWNMSVNSTTYLEIVITNMWYPVWPKVRNHGRVFPTPWGTHNRMPNDNGIYSPSQVIALGPPPLINNGKWRVQSRVQDGGSISGAPNWQNVRPPAINWTKDPDGSWVPGVWPGPYVIEGTLSPTPEQIRENWPGDKLELRTVLPWTAWRPGPAWRDIPLVNRLREVITPDDRSSSYGPPIDPNKPAQVIHRPPGRGEVESKRRTNSAALLWWYRSAKKLWHESGEYCDRVKAIYKALPASVRRQSRKTSCADKTAIILNNLHLVDVEEAIINLVENEIEDAIIGAGFKNLDNAAKRLGIPGWRVEMALSGNVETAIEFLFELKKALTP